MATIAQSRVLDTKLLPVDAQRVVTNHLHVLFGEISGNAPLLHLEVRRGPSTFIEYQALPIVHSVQHAQHSTYNASKYEPMDDGLDPFYPPETIPFASIGEAAGNFSGTDYRGDNAPNSGVPVGFDSSPGDTFITYDDDADPANYSQVFGFVLQYKAPWLLTGTPNYWDLTGGPGLVQLTLINTVSPTSENAARLVATFGIPRAETPQTLISIIPAAHIFSVWNQYDPLAGKSGDISWTLHMSALIEASTLSAASDANFVFYPLMLDVPRLDAIGGNKLFVPAANPQQILVRDYVPPDASHDLPGWPGGAISVDVVRQHYKNGDTLVDVEQVGPRLTTSGRLEGMQQIHNAIALRERFEKEQRRDTVALMLASRR